MDYAPLMDSKRDRLAEIETIMGHEDFYADPKKAGEISQEYNVLKKALANWDTFNEAKANLEENRELVKSGDAELAEIAAEEIPELEKQLEDLELDIQYALLPRDPTESRDAIVERFAQRERVVRARNALLRQRLAASSDPISFSCLPARLCCRIRAFAPRENQLCGYDGSSDSHEKVG